MNRVIGAAVVGVVLVLANGPGFAHDQKLPVGGNGPLTSAPVTEVRTRPAAERIAAICSYHHSVAIHQLDWVTDTGPKRTN